MNFRPVQSMPFATSGVWVSPNVLAMTVAVYAMFLFAPRVLHDGDTYWHIAAGNWMLAQQSVPRTDPFAFTTAGMVWVPHEWLAEVIMALAFRFGGWAGVVMLTAAAAALAIGLMARHLERFLAPVPAYAMLLLAVLTVMPTMLARPHILALPIMEFWVARLVIARAEGRAPSVWLAGAMLVWTNLHGGFMIGLAVAGAMAVEAIASAGPAWRAALRGWLFFLIAATVAACLTPLGLDGILFPFQMLRLGALRNIQEWQAPNFQELQPLEFILIAALLLGLTGGVRLPWFRVSLFLGLLHSALQHTRFQLQLSFIGFLLVAPALGLRFPRNAGGADRVGRAAVWVLAGLLLLLSAVRFVMPITRADIAGSPVTALAHISPEMRAQPVLNAYPFGGFLIFHGMHPFVDSRADLYRDAFLQDYLAIQQPQPDRVREVVTRYGITWTLQEPGSALASWLDTQPDWQRLYADDYAVIHIKR